MPPPDGVILRPPPVRVLNRALLGGGGGGETPPCPFPSIAQKRKEIELQNFQNPVLHQFCTGCPKENFTPMIRRS